MAVMPGPIGSISGGGNVGVGNPSGFSGGLTSAMFGPTSGFGGVTGTFDPNTLFWLRKFGINPAMLMSGAGIAGGGSTMGPNFGFDPSAFKFDPGVFTPSQALLGELGVVANNALQGGFQPNLAGTRVGKGPTM